MAAAEYYEYKKQLMPAVRESYDALAEDYDIIVIEGAGSPAEINLRENDLVNMGLAEELDAPVLLAGDIDRGGVDWTSRQRRPYVRYPRWSLLR